MYEPLTCLAETNTGPWCTVHSVESMIANLGQHARQLTAHQLAIADRVHQAAQAALGFMQQQRATQRLMQSASKR